MLRNLCRFAMPFLFFGLSRLVWGSSYTVTNYGVLPNVTPASVTDVGDVYGYYVQYSTFPNSGANAYGFSAANGAITTTAFDPYYAASSNGAVIVSAPPANSAPATVVIQDGSKVINTGLSAYTSFGNTGQNYLPEAASDKGVVVGEQYYNSGNVGGLLRGFIYQNGSLTYLNYSNAIATNLTGVNDAGEIVGFATDEYDNRISFLYQSGLYTVLMTSNKFVVATGINDSGVISFSNGELYSNGQFYANGAGFSDVLDISNSGVLLGYDGGPSFSVAVPNAASPVPEPASFTLPVAAAAFLFAVRRRLN